MINIKRNVLGILFAILIVFNFWSASKNEAIAAAVESVPGQIYILTEEEDDYDCSKKTGVSSEKGIETYGKFFVQGDIASVEKKDELPSYKVNGVTLALVYEFDKKYLEDKKGEWQLIEEDAEEINGVELQDEMGKGVIVVQRSIDGKNWRTVSEYDNVFEKNSLEDGEIYSACDLELINGCYYRVLVAYGLRKMQEEDDSFVGKIIDKNIYLYHRYVEQYVFMYIAVK